MSNTKPVVLKGWSEPDQKFMAAGVAFLFENEHENANVPATLVIGEEAIPKSEVEKMLRAGDAMADVLANLSFIDVKEEDALVAWVTAKAKFSPKSNTQQTEQ